MQVLVPLTKDKVANFASKALLTLAYIVDEENSKVIMANAGRYGDLRCMDCLLLFCNSLQHIIRSFSIGR